ncbi:MAG: bifunctional serine/threonine-protein kinase/formylglycine-generating enzyme family protein [Phycisphaerales bacterium]
MGAAALGHAHGTGVVHRDVKPSNILLDGAGLPRLTDFGIAKDLDATTLTRSGSQPGTPAYMSPEQLGVSEAPMGPASDICSLGLVLFEGLTLTKALPGKDADAVKRHWRGRAFFDPAADSRSVHPALALICRRATAFDPKDRFRSASEMAATLDRAIHGRLRAPMIPWRDWVARARRNPKRIGAAAVGLLVVSTATVSLWPSRTTGTLVVDAPTRSAVWIRPVDPGTRMPGAAQPRGVTPLRASLEPGVYRVMIDAGQGRSAELTRVVQRGQTALAELAPPNENGTDNMGMVFVEGGDALVGQPQPQFPQLVQRPVHVEPFWIDRREVTNAEYRAFVVATGRRPPFLWPDPYDPSWDRLPVTGVTLEEARAYAEWVGKRLPTDAEWEVAAAGLDGAPFPWVATGGPPAPILADGGVELASWTLGPDDPTSAAAYLEHVRPADQANYDVGPFGLINAWSNVAEWTESVLVLELQGVPTLWAISKGRTWADDAPALAFLQTANLSQLDARSVGLGFRCARSASAAQN